MIRKSVKTAKTAKERAGVGKRACRSRGANRGPPAADPVGLLSPGAPEALIASVPIPVFWKDREGRYRGCNRAFEELLGVRVADITGRTAAECWPAADSKVFQSMDDALLRHPGDQRYSTSMTTRDGRALDVVFHKQTLAGPDGAVAGVIGAIVDITGIRNAEEALRKERALLRCLIDAIPEIIFFKDTDGRYLGANPAFEAYAGRVEKEVVGLTDLDFFPRMEAEAYRKLDREILEANAQTRVEEWITYPDGHRALVETIKTPIMDAARRTLGLVGVSRDITHRRLAADEIANARHNFETFFNTIDDFLFVLDERGNILHVNETVVRRLGFTENELRDQSVLIVHPPDRREEAGRIVGEMLAGTSDACPVPLQARDGTLIPVETRVKPGTWDGRPALYGVSKDVTELQRSEEKFARAFHAGAVLMAISTVEDGRFIDVNSCFLETFGYSREEVIGRTSSDLGLFRNPADRNAVRGHVEAEGRARGVEVDVRTRSGEIRHGLFSADIVDVGGRRCLLTVMTDITAAKVMRDALQSRLKFRSLLNSLSRDLINPPSTMDLGIQTSLEGIGRFTGADRAYVFLLREDPSLMDNTHEWCAEGIEPQIENLQNLPCSIFPWLMERFALGETIRAPRVADFPEEARAEREILQAQGIRSVILSPLIHRMELIGFIGFDAVRHETNWTEDHVELLRLAGDMIVNALQQKNTQDGLRVAKDQAEAAKHAQMMFLANMSHEIRTPLNAILGYAQILQQDPSGSGAGQQAVRTIMRSADHLLTLINDILALSRCEAGQLALQANAFDLHSLLASMLDLFRVRAGHLSLTLDYPDGMPRWLLADEPKVRQVVLNLVGNAVKFTEAGGITVTAGVAPGVPGTTDRTVHVEVADTGCGISAEELPHIFEEFKQAEAGKRKHSGTGLGLALSRRYARALGGDVTASSGPGAGSIFRFTFPAAPSATPVRPASGRSVRFRVPGGIAPPRLLVVDDEETNRGMLRAMLSGAGFDVRLADDGEEACRIAGEWRPAVVLMDRRMPGIDGYEAMQRIKREAGSPVPVVIVTAAGFGDAHMEAIKKGADGFIPKPVRAERLFGELGRILNLKLDAAGAPDGDASEALSPADVTALPAEVRETMLAGIRRGDIAEIRRQIDRILPSLPRTARLLRALAGRFAYDELETLLGKPPGPPS